MNNYTKRKEYLRKYDSNNYAKILVRFRKDDEYEMRIMEYVKAFPNTGKYIKKLIKKDFEGNATN